MEAVMHLTGNQPFWAEGIHTETGAWGAFTKRTGTTGFQGLTRRGTGNET